MEALIKFRNFIKSLEDKDFYKYCAIAGSVILLLLGLIFFIFWSKVNRYTNEFMEINKLRNSTKTILTDYKIVNQQRAKVEEILAQNKNFILAKAYKDIIDELNLGSFQSEEPKRSQGQIVGDKIETILSGSLSGISMKQLTDLLSEIANVEQIYPKDLVIKKSPNKNAVDIELTIATLETSNISE